MWRITSLNLLVISFEAAQDAVAFLGRISPTDREEHNRGITNGHNYFFTKQAGVGVGASQFVLWAGGVYLIHPTLPNPRSFPTPNSCSRGGQQSTATHSCPFQSPHTPVKACWIQLWDQLSSNLSPHELFRTICKFSFFIFLVSTTSVWRKIDAAAPRELPISQLSASKATGRWEKYTAFPKYFLHFKYST